jgi:hypothetical protein
MPTRQVFVRVRRVHITSSASCFVAAWLIAELMWSLPVRLVGHHADLVTLAVDADREERLLTLAQEVLAQQRFDGWELCVE